jgi:hypothetical protein
MSRAIVVTRFFFFSPICSSESAGTSMPHSSSTRALVIDVLPKGNHLPEPVIRGARRQIQLIARFTNRFALDKDETTEFRLPRLCRMIDSAAEAAV